MKNGCLLRSLSAEVRREIEKTGKSCWRPEWRSSVPAFRYHFALFRWETALSQYDYTQ